MQRTTSTLHGDEPNLLDTTGLCLLCLDGGGVRGLSTLYILKIIMDRLNHERKTTANLPPVKPCEMFDLIGGTSTGGLIAIMLGRLEMDVDECIVAYSDLAAAVFSEKLSRVPVTINGKIKPRFDSAKLEKAIRKVVAQNGALEIELLNDGNERGCRTFVCTADRNTKDIIRLRSYGLPEEPDIRATICQAALATSAATTFFEPVSIGNRTFADGGLGANNPVDEMEGEASNIWCSETGNLKPLVKCFISIGTGNPGKKAFDDSMIKFLGQTVVDIATETENTERTFMARWAGHFDNKRYFRFNVDQGLQDIGLDEYNRVGAMEAATSGYITHTAQRFRVRDCVQNLKLKQHKTETFFATILDGSTTQMVGSQRTLEAQEGFTIRKNRTIPHLKWFNLINALPHLGPTWSGEPQLGTDRLARYRETWMNLLAVFGAQDILSSDFMKNIPIDIEDLPARCENPLAIDLACAALLAGMAGCDKLVMQEGMPTFSSDTCRLQFTPGGGPFTMIGRFKQELTMPTYCTYSWGAFKVPLRGSMGALSYGSEETMPLTHWLASADGMSCPNLFQDIQRTRCNCLHAVDVSSADRSGLKLPVLALLFADSPSHPRIFPSERCNLRQAVNTLADHSIYWRHVMDHRRETFAATFESVGISTINPVSKAEFDMEPFTGDRFETRWLNLYRSGRSLKAIELGYSWLASAKPSAQEGLERPKWQRDFDDSSLVIIDGMIEHCNTYMTTGMSSVQQMTSNGKGLLHTTVSCQLQEVDWWLGERKDIAACEASILVKNLSESEASHARGGNRGCVRAILIFRAILMALLLSIGLDHSALKEAGLLDGQIVLLS